MYPQATGKFNLHREWCRNLFSRSGNMIPDTLFNSISDYWKDVGYCGHYGFSKVDATKIKDNASSKSTHPDCHKLTVNIVGGRCPLLPLTICHNQYLFDCNPNLIRGLLLRFVANSLPKQVECATRHN